MLNDHIKGNPVFTTSWTSFRIAPTNLLYALRGYATAFVTPVVERWLELEIIKCGHHEGR